MGSSFCTSRGCIRNVSRFLSELTKVSLLRYKDFCVCGDVNNRTTVRPSTCNMVPYHVFFIVFSVNLLGHLQTGDARGEYRHTEQQDISLQMRDTVYLLLLYMFFFRFSSVLIIGMEYPFNINPRRSEVGCLLAYQMHYAVWIHAAAWSC